MENKAIDDKIKKWAKVKDAAKYLGVTPRTVFRWADAGRIPTKIERHRRFVLIDLESLAAEATSPASMILTLQSQIDFLKSQIESQTRIIEKLSQDR